ncbi:5-formyltetrahydrofolate cyclo-ligase [Oceanobacillus bengalensis]|uniref:5-formyltetrahydrofolate cyclo-ligase n=2 Tax=Oceanobacillus bengalensis TaxID=1435466 RepID=A0A494Z8E4_9BACI|nr:5-formyltetrahydrofolate cyclo-ligase [Oceanobacillus bengalensis]
MIEKLKALSGEERERTESNLLHYLTTSESWNQSETIGITVSHGFEWNTKAIIEAGWKHGKIICVPKCFPKEKKMVFYKLEHFDQLEVVYYNLLEPKPEETMEIEKQEMDLLIVPGVVFDKEGYRIGFGGGYYDRFLTDFQNITVSLLHSIQRLEGLPVEAHDLAVNYLITEKGISMTGS